FPYREGHVVDRLFLGVDRISARRLDAIEAVENERPAKRHVTALHACGHRIVLNPAPATARYRSRMPRLPRRRRLRHANSCKRGHLRGTPSTRRTQEIDSSFGKAGICRP